VTILDGPPVPDVRPGFLRRAWSLPLRAHAAALAVILLALVPLVGTSASFSTDEGAAIVQAQSLARGGGWIVEHPMPEVDPEGTHYPLELSERGPRGFVAFGKHPLYPLLLAAADRVGGVTAMVLLSLAGTLVAAALAGALARRLDPGLARPALWVVGLASPLLFDGFLVMAHTLGAALAAAAVLAAVAAMAPPQPQAQPTRRSLALAAAVAPLVAAGVLMRSEAVFLALALAVVAGVIALRHPGRENRARAPAVVIGLGALLASVGAHLFETWWLARITGGGTASLRAAPAAGDSMALVTGRWRGFLRTVLTPTYGVDPRMTFLLLTALVAVAYAAYTARWHPERRGPLMVSASVAALGAVLAVATGPATVVPGLLVAFPVAAAGLALVRRTTLRTLTARISLGVFALYAGGVIASQYAVGGSTEWGGRFLALGLPVVVPVLLLALKQQAAGLDRDVRRWAVGALVVCSLATSTLAITSLRHQHRALGQLVAAAEQAGQDVAAAGAEGPPVMIATYGSVPRWAWSTFDRQRWLTATPDDLEGLLARLRAVGVSRAGLVTPDIGRDRPLLGRSVVLADESPSLAPGWHVLVVEIR
jgi:hypothetical protein